MTDTPDANGELPPLITFPARFPIKIMGKNNPGFQAAILGIANRLIPPEKLLNFNEKPSSNGKYLGITLIAIFDSQTEIDAVYQALTAEPDVIMVL